MVNPKNQLEWISSSVLNLLGIFFAVILFELVARSKWSGDPEIANKFDILIWITIIAIILAGQICLASNIALNLENIPSRLYNWIRILFFLLLAIITLIIPLFLIIIKQYV